MRRLLLSIVSALLLATYVFADLSQSRIPDSAKSALDLNQAISLVKKGDLIFEIATNNIMSNAITEATASNDEVKFSHVGIIDVDSRGDITVIEATGKHGVTITPIDSFMAYAKCGAVVKRCVSAFPIDSVITRAKSYLGRGYDWWYLPDNDEIYCSELVEKCYLQADGTPLFSTIPMNFRDKDGNMPQFWTDLFEKLGRPIPEGVPGTNPSQLSHSEALSYICTITSTHKDSSP